MIPDPEFSGRVAALAKSIKLPHHATITNHMARAFYIAEQAESTALSMQACAPCTWFGLFAGKVCDNCQHAACIFCEGLMGSCKWCTVWQLIPTTVTREWVLRFRAEMPTWSCYGPITVDVLADGNCPLLQQWPTKLRKAFENTDSADPATFLSQYLSALGCGIPSYQVNFIGAPH